MLEESTLQKVRALQEMITTQGTSFSLKQWQHSSPEFAVELHNQLRTSDSRHTNTWVHAAGYTLLTGVFIGLGGIFGYVSFIVELIPRAVLAPILIFVAFDIIAQSFQACPARHAPAVAFAFFPTIARLLAIKLGNPDAVLPETFTKLMAIPGKALPELLVIVALGNGFIITGMLWGAFLAELIDRKLRISAAYLLVLALLAFFGIIHSAMPDGVMYLPWTLDGLAKQVPYQFTVAYLVLAAFFFVMSWTKESREPISGMGH